MRAIARAPVRCALLAALVSLVAGAAAAQDYAAGAIKVSKVWTREVPAGSKVAAGFMTITNTGKEADTLIGGSSAIAGAFEVHEMKMAGGIMKMRALGDGLAIPPGATVVLMPSSFHVMLLDLKEAPRRGATVKGSLTFAKAGRIDVEYQVAPLGARSLDDSKPQGNRSHSHH